MKTLPFIFILVTCAAKLAAQGNSVPDSVQIERMIESGARAVAANDTATATRLLLRARDQASKLQLPALEARAARIAGNMFYSYEIYQRAFANYTIAKNIYSERGSESELAEMTIALARTQYHRGNYRLAVNNFVEALQLARKLNNKGYEAEALENLGLLYNSFQGFNEGTGYYKRAYAVKKSIGDEKGAVRVAQILGETYYRKRMFDSAYYFSSAAAADAGKTGLATEAFMTRLNMGMSLIRKKEWKQAQDILSRLTLPADPKQNVNSSLRYDIAMGNLYMSQNDSAAGKKYYDKAIAAAQLHGFPEMYALIYRNMAESYYELKNYQKAYEYYNRHNGYVSQMYSGRNLENLGSLENIMNAATSRDEVKALSAEKAQQRNQLERELLLRQSLEKENALMDDLFAKEKKLGEAAYREKQSLERENAAKSAQLKTEKELRTAESEKLKDEKKRRLILLGGMGLTLLLGSAIFILFRRQRRKNQIIQKQADDMQVLMQEIHHRVKNNLQIISSLLDLQSLTIKDAQASEAVKEGKNRVQSMALIHQNLYSEGNIKGIQVKEYTGNLVTTLCGSYNISAGQLQVQTHIDDIKLDVDTMIPLGLVLNELVSNALKYAAGNGRAALLEIYLQQQPGQLLLRVRDNGPGFPNGMDIQNSRSFGLKMIRAFAQKLKAKLDIYNDNGAVVEMRITKFKTA